jgi:hypothetical protein
MFPQTLLIKKSSDEGGQGARHFFLKKFATFPKIILFFNNLAPLFIFVVI